MAGKFLIASADAGTREIVCRAFAQFDLEAELCEGVAEAFTHLHRRYTGVVVDCEDAELAMQLIAGLRHHSEGEPTAILALLPPNTPAHQVLASGATIVLHHPLRLDRLTLSLRVALRLTTPDEKAAAAKAAGRAAARPELSRR